MNDRPIDTSVVIGFRDWGEDRIRLAGESILASFGEFRGELIISDYGSREPAPAKAVADALGARYVHTPGDPEWSRSRALNAGFAIADGEVLISTDADMLFSPSSMARITELSYADPASALFLQCRDLPEDLDSSGVAAHGMDWERFERVGRLRPRWGMGGMMAVSRAGFHAVRGFDERLHTYGGEDLDFAQRLRRAGYKTVWVDEPDVRMYHMWHPSSRVVAEATPGGKEAVDFNKQVVYQDKSFVRNAVSWRFAPEMRAPLVTVAIVTHNRATMLEQAINSALAQTVQDIEVLIVDDGSTDNTAEVVRSFGDSRVRYAFQEQAGISVARNYAAKLSRGTYTAVLDDDDLMPADRLEIQLEAIDGGAAGSIGSFVNFNDETGEMQLIVSQLPTLATAAEKGGAPGHGTWLVQTDMLRKFGYDESLSSGVDNNLMLRMIRAGLRFNHCGRPVLLRRMHPNQVTMTDSIAQGSTASRAYAFLSFSMTAWSFKKFEEARSHGTYPPGVDRDAAIASVRPFLPDHLVHRDVRVSRGRLQDLRQLSLDGEIIGVTSTRDGVTTHNDLSIRDASLRDLALLRRAGVEWQVASSERVLDEPDLFDPESWIRRELAALLRSEDGASTRLAVVTADGSAMSDDTTSSHEIAVSWGEEQSASFQVLCFDNPVAASRALVVADGDAFLVGPFTLGGAS